MIDKMITKLVFALHFQMLWN